uniref:C2H2-type domain-containing protein n=1 Tax=Heterorhabditis bacteriophora TaxID=37862 RepID=A0A1I7WVR1_HETBA
MSYDNTNLHHKVLIQFPSDPDIIGASSSSVPVSKIQSFPSDVSSSSSNSNVSVSNYENTMDNEQPGTEFITLTSVSMNDSSCSFRTELDRDDLSAFDCIFEGMDYGPQVEKPKFAGYFDVYQFIYEYVLLQLEEELAKEENEVDNKTRAQEKLLKELEDAVEEAKMKKQLAAERRKENQRMRLLRSSLAIANKVSGFILFFVSMPKLPFGCQACGKSFASHSSLSTHRKRIHENKREHECDICGKGMLFLWVISLLYSNLSKMCCDCHQDSNDRDSVK